jgi:hypothetical protein
VVLIIVIKRVGDECLVEEGLDAVVGEVREGQ